jgi:hypothetical protein
VKDDELRDMLAQRDEGQRAAAHRVKQDWKSLDMPSHRELSETPDPPPKAGYRRRRRWFRQQQQERF